MIKNQRGLTGVDVTIAIVAVMIFTSIILSLMFNVKVENTKIKMKALANVYLTKTMENVGIANYDDVTTNNVNLFPDMAEPYQGTITVEKYSDIETNKKDMVKIVSVKLSYTIGQKTYEETVQRLKVKE